MPRQLVWFRNDLRTRDNPALAAAMHAGETIALFVISAPQWRGHGMGNNRIAFLLRSLEALSVDLAALRVPLRIVMAASFDDVPAQLARVVAALGVGVVHCNAEYAIDERRRDARAATVIEREGAQLRLHHGGVLSPPGRGAHGQRYPVPLCSRRS
ncbi:MAG: deoxyribodipyrimidine photo-lyase, partial [Gammaproteobacteria bacterium]|nr:deoxyribodipyrimidine photo-lyase [Gammaproteobacteria bacterium]